MTQICSIVYLAWFKFSGWGHYLSNGSRFEEAEGFLELETIYKPGGIESEMNLLNRRGLCASARKNYTGAEQYLLESSRYAESSPNPDEDRLCASICLAKLYDDWESEDFDKTELAEKFHKQTLELAEASGCQSSSKALAYNNYGLRCKTRKDFVRAEQFFLKAKQLGDMHPLVRHQIDIMIRYNLANLYRYETPPRLKDAESLLLEALDLFNLMYGDNKTQVAPMLLNLSGLYIQMSEIDEAEACLRKSISIWENYKLNPELMKSRAQMELAKILISRGKSDEGITLLQAAESSYLAEIDIRPAFVVKKLRYIAVEFEHLGHYARAAKNYEIVFELSTKLFGCKYENLFLDLASLSSCYQRLNDSIQVDRIEGLVEEYQRAPQLDEL